MAEKVDPRDYAVESVERKNGNATLVVIRVYNRRISFRSIGVQIGYETEIIGKFLDYFSGGKVEYEKLFRRACRQARGIFKEQRKGGDEQMVKAIFSKG